MMLQMGWQSSSFVGLIRQNLSFDKQNFNSTSDTFLIGQGPSLDFIDKGRKVRETKKKEKKKEREKGPRRGGGGGRIRKE
jgi:hypothetical protein